MILSCYFFCGILVFFRICLVVVLYEFFYVYLLVYEVVGDSRKNWFINFLKDWWYVKLVWWICMFFCKLRYLIWCKILGMVYLVGDLFLLGLIVWMYDGWYFMSVFIKVLVEVLILLLVVGGCFLLFWLIWLGKSLCIKWFWLVWNMFRRFLRRRFLFLLVMLFMVYVILLV